MLAILRTLVVELGRRLWMRSAVQLESADGWEMYASPFSVTGYTIYVLAKDHLSLPSTINSTCSTKSDTHTAQS